APPKGALPAVGHQVRGNTIVLSLPDVAHDKVLSDRYQAQMRPNGRLAGLLTKNADGEANQLVPLVFAEVRLPGGPAGQTPRLRTRLPDSRWVFCFDQRRRCGYLLAMPRERDRDELRFHIDWVSGE